MNPVFTLFAAMNLDDSEYRQSLAGAETATREAGRGMERSVDQSTRSIEQRLVRAGESMQRVGGGMSRWITGPLVALGAAAVASANQLGSAADAILDLGDITGLSTDRIQAYRAVTREAGIDTDAFATAAEGLQRRLSATGEESAGVQETLDLLGVSVRNADGSLRSMDDLLPDVVAGLAGMENPAQRNAAALQVLGRQGTALAPALGLGTQRIEELTRAAMESGEVLSGDALEAANAYRIEWENARAELGLAGREIQVAIIPAVTLLMQLLRDRVIPVVRDFAERIAAVVQWFTDLDERLQVAIIGFGAVVAAIGPLLVIGGKLLTMVPLITAAFTALRTAMLLFTGPLGIAAVLATALGVTVFRALQRTREEAGRVDAEIERMSGTLAGSTGSWDALAGGVTSAADLLRGDAREAFIEYANEAIATSDSIEEAAGLIEREWRTLAGATRDETDRISGALHGLRGDAGGMSDAVTGSLSEVRDALEATADDTEHVLLAAIRDAAAHLRGDARDAFLEYAAEAVTTSGTVGEAAEAIAREWDRAAARTRDAVAVYEPAVRTAIERTSEMRDALMGAAAEDEAALRGAVARAASEIDGPGRQAFVNYAEEAIATASTVQEAAAEILREWAHVVHAAELAQLEMRAERLRGLIAVREAEREFVTAPAKTTEVEAAIAGREARLAELRDDAAALSRIIEAGGALSSEQRRQWNQVRNEIDQINEELPFLRRNLETVTSAAVDVHDPRLANLRADLADLERQQAEIVSGFTGSHELTVLVRTRAAGDAAPLRSGVAAGAPSDDDPTGLMSLQASGVEVEMRYHPYVHDGVHGPETLDEFHARMERRKAAVEMWSPVAAGAPRDVGVRPGFGVAPPAPRLPGLEPSPDGLAPMPRIPMVDMSAIAAVDARVLDEVHEKLVAIRAAEAAIAEERANLATFREVEHEQTRALYAAQLEAVEARAAEVASVREYTQHLETLGRMVGEVNERQARRAATQERLAAIAADEGLREYTQGLEELGRLVGEVNERQARRVATEERLAAIAAEQGLRDYTQNLEELGRMVGEVNERQARRAATEERLARIAADEGLREYTQDLEELGRMSREAAVRAQRLADALQRGREAYEATPAGIAELAAESTRLARVQEQLGQATLNDVTMALLEQQGALQSALASVDEGSTEWYAYADALAAVEREITQNQLRAYQAHADALREQMEQVGVNSREYEGLREQLNATLELMRALGANVPDLGPGGAADRVRASVDAFLDRLGPLGEGLKGVADRVVNSTSLFSGGIEALAAGPMAGLGAVLGDVIGRSEGFQNMLEALGRILDPVVKVFDYLFNAVTRFINAILPWTRAQEEEAGAPRGSIAWAREQRAIAEASRLEAVSAADRERAAAAVHMWDTWLARAEAGTLGQWEPSPAEVGRPITDADRERRSRWTEVEGPDAGADPGSIAYWQERMRAARDAWTAASTAEARAVAQQRIDIIQAAIDAIQREGEIAPPGEPDPVLGRIEALQEDRASLLEQRLQATDEAAIARLNREIRDVDDAIRRLLDLGMEHEDEIGDVREDLDRLDFGATPQTVQFATAVPLAEAADRNLYAAELFAGAMERLLPSGDGGMPSFATALDRHTPVLEAMTDTLERLMRDGVRIGVETMQATTGSPTAALR